MFCHLHRADRPASHFISAVTLLVLLAAFTLTSSPVQATTAAGRTAGAFGVSPTGAATYTIPIWAPPGPNGMQPSIALAYSSQSTGEPGALVEPTCGTQPAGQTNCLPMMLGLSSGASSMGVGWSLQGLSSIYRCNLTFAQDAAPAPVTLSTSDGYCLDGQRLRLTSGTYGVAGSTYQTEIANFVNVTAYGSAGNGPAYWIAQDRNGTTRTYGNGGNSQILASGSSTALSWMLNEVSDPPGNTMTIAYNTTTGSPPCVSSAPPGVAIPCTISWTPSSHGSSTYNYTLTFAYGTNAAPPRGYVAGTPVNNPNLLSSIAIASSGTVVKTYNLGYQVSATTGRDLLIQVQECAGSGTSNCLAPTAITYQTPVGGVGTSATTTSISTARTLYAHHDFSGDGYQDLLFSNRRPPAFE